MWIYMGLHVAWTLMDSEWKDPTLFLYSDMQVRKSKAENKDSYVMFRSGSF